MKKIDAASDHELLAVILHFQLATLECVVKTCVPYTKASDDILDFIAKYRKELFEDEIHVD